MKSRPADVGAKAIEIANALLDGTMEEGMAIRVAIARAKLRGERRSGPAEPFRK